jgi:hypothetical protein
VKKLIALCLLVGTLSACDLGQVTSTINVNATVVDARGLSRRFWVSLETEDGKRWPEQRLGSKRCPSGPEELPVGKQILVKINTVTYKNKPPEQAIDRSDLTSRFCYQ